MHISYLTYTKCMHLQIQKEQTNWSINYISPLSLCYSPLTSWQTNSYEGRRETWLSVLALKYMKSLYINNFFNSNWNLLLMRLRSTEQRHTWVQGLPLIQGTTVGDGSDPTAAQDEQLLSHHSFKSIYIELGKAHFLGMRIFWQTRT